jgi:ATP-binding cassette, subfamily C, bacterial CydD
MPEGLPYTSLIMDEGLSWLRERGRVSTGHLARSVALGEAGGIALVLQAALMAAIGKGAMMEGKGPSELWPLFAWLLAVILLRALFLRGSRREAFECSSAVKMTVRSELIDALRRVGPLALVRMRSGETAQVVLDAVEGLEAYYSGYLPQRAAAALLPFTILAAVFPLDWISGLALVLTAAFLPLSMILIGEEAQARNQRLWASLARISGRFLDSLRGMETVKIFGAARREAAEIERSSEEYRLATMSVLRIAFLSSFMLELIAAVSIAIVAVVAGLRLLSGSMDFAPAYFILLVAPEYFLSLRALGAQYHARTGALAAAERIRGLLEILPTAPDAKPGTDLGTGTGTGLGASLGFPTRPTVPTGTKGAAADGQRHGASLSFEAVSFSYPGRPVLDGLSFSVLPGERVALVGPSGSGKSTVISLLLGFAAPSSGRLLFDGREHRLLGREELCSEIAWLPQRPTMFRGSIRSNIGLGREGASDEEIEEAAELAEVLRFARDLPRGLDSPIGEGGSGLSVGQAQRVALARLFLRSPRLVLLDEPTAHLDPESEALVNTAIAALGSGRSLVLASHRALPFPCRTIALETIGRASSGEDDPEKGEG